MTGKHAESLCATYLRALLWTQSGKAAAGTILLGRNHWRAGLQPARVTLAGTHWALPPKEDGE